jgi:hypothetical protein
MPGWTDQVTVGQGGLERLGNGVTRIDAIAPTPEQTWQ